MKKINIKKFVEKYYRNKDIMHDITHIDRILKRAKQLGKKIPHDPKILEAAAYFHGIIYSDEKTIRSFLKAHQIKKEIIDFIIQVSWESQKNSIPESIEGKLLHDSHLLEGDDFFIVTKTLVTGTVRGQTLAKTIEYLEKQVLGKSKCAFSRHQALLKKRELLAAKFVKSIKREL